MPRQSPVPDEVDAPYFEAANDDRLVIQYCSSCARFQHPPDRVCYQCKSADGLSWREVSGRGTIYSYGVVHDSPITSLQIDQPYNVVVIDLDDCPGINVLSHLPGTPVDEVPIGGKVELMFLKTEATGQKVPEWRLVD